MEYRTEKPNRYLALYLEKNGISKDDGYDPAAYMAWLDRFHDEYRQKKGLPLDIDLTDEEVEEFCRFVEETA